MNTVKMRELKEDLGSKDAYNKQLAVERTRDGDIAWLVHLAVRRVVKRKEETTWEVDGSKLSDEGKN